jgi:hypothetical protein
MAGAALRAHKPWGEVFGALPTGLNWLVWFGVLWLLTRGPRAAHPPTDDDALSPVRRVLAWGTLCLFVLLFMPFPLSQH